jgi:hypothetical protein
MVKLKENQKLWFVGAGNFARTRGEVTVTSVGRKWANVEGAFIGRIAVDTLKADGGAYSPPGQCYVSQDDWVVQEGPSLAWRDLRFKMGGQCPKGLSYVTIVEAAKLLGFDVTIQPDAK